MSKHTEPLGITGHSLRGDSEGCVESANARLIAALEGQLAEAQKIRSAEVTLRDEQIEMEKARVRQIDGENQGIRRQLAEAQERLAMALEALEYVPFREVQMIEDGPAHRPMIPFLLSRSVIDRMAAVVDATAPAVAEFVAGVERRGAKAALEAFAERDDWTLDVPRILVDRIRRLLTEAARAAEVERLDSDKI